MMRKIKSKEGRAFVDAAIARANITDPIERAQLLAQIGHESGGFTYLEEIASGKAYEGRKDLGNVIAGDGVRYKGRGFIMLTGRSNYEYFGRILKVDLVKYPHLASDPILAADIAILFWNNRVAPRISRFTDTRAVTKIINGGYNGLKDRMNRFYKFKKEIQGELTLCKRIKKGANEICNIG